jgi:hypothetical protein
MPLEEYKRSGTCGNHRSALIGQLIRTGLGMYSTTPLFDGLDCWLWLSESQAKATVPPSWPGLASGKPEVASVTPGPQRQTFCCFSQRWFIIKRGLPQLQILSRLTLLLLQALERSYSNSGFKTGPSKSHPKPDNAILAGAEITKTLT